MILISATGLGRQYVGDPVFTELAFEVRAGERIGLVGPNGAGKTTLIKLLAGLEQPDYGSLFVRPGIRVSLLRQESDFEPGETLMRGRQVGARVADRPAARARGGRPGDGRGRRRRRPRARRAALRRAAPAARAPGRLFDRPPRRRGAHRPGLRRGRVSPRRRRRFRAASNRG